MESLSMYSFFIRLLLFSTIILRFIHVVCINTSFLLWLSRILLYGFTTTYLFILSIDGHLGCFQFGAVQIKLLKHLCITVCIGICFLFSWINVQECNSWSMWLAAI